MPAAVIKDAPRFAYRGMMLDVGRHFFSVDFVKRYIDLLAMHNMNYFHWHLTEDQGWSSSHAQSLVKGTVTDGIGEPLPGVSVVVKGTTNGTITDVNGKYSIQATAKDILSFSYVGMSDQEIKVAGQTTINVVMKDDVAALDEVIVVGYGTAKKQSLTGAVSAVKGDELLKAPATNVSSLLGGRLPGISSVYFLYAHFSIGRYSDGKRNIV